MKRSNRWPALVLSLAWPACSGAPEQIELPPLDPRSEARFTSEFDNPGSTRDAVDAATSGDASTPDGGFSRDSCVNGFVSATRIPPKVVLVLDGSCSMSTDYPSNGEQSASQCTRNAQGRWAALRNALVGPNGVVPKLEKAVAFGLVVYGTERRCPIPIEPVDAQLGNLSRIEAGLPAIQPGMYTPTGPALDWVYDNMIQAQGPDSRGAAQIVILATDGEPNSCGGFGFGGASTTNYRPSVEAVMKGARKGATTYVISLADASGPFHDHLRELANLGDPAANGAAMLYEPASPDQLAATLDGLTLAAIRCEIELNGSILIDRACEGKVKLDGVELGCNDPNGWAAIDERNIRLQGMACEKLRASHEAVIEASFACTGFRPD